MRQGLSCCKIYINMPQPEGQWMTYTHTHTHTILIINQFNNFYALETFMLIKPPLIWIELKRFRFPTAPEGRIMQHVKARAKPAGGGVRGMGRWMIRPEGETVRYSGNVIYHKQAAYPNAHILIISFQRSARWANAFALRPLAA